MTTEEVIEGTAVELYEPAQPPVSLFRTDDPVEVVEKATAVADALKGVIEKQQLFTVIQGKKHIRVEGWQLLGSMLGVTAICVGTEPVEGGFKATVEARSADGRVVGRADALCTKGEKNNRWTEAKADDYARLSMAQTRATSKALKGPLGFVVSLAGYATTPAEEMTFVEPEQPPNLGHVEAPVARQELPDETVKDVLAAIKRAKQPPDWLRMQLVALGVENVPEGALKRGTIFAMSPDQAADLISLCDEASA